MIRPGQKYFVSDGTEPCRNLAVEELSLSHDRGGRHSVFVGETGIRL